MADEKPWLSGKPYYCAKCGAGGPERMACEMPDCELESETEALKRRANHLSNESCARQADFYGALDAGRYFMGYQDGQGQAGAAPGRVLCAPAV